MKRKYIIISVLVIVIFLIVLYCLNINNKNRFYLNDKYYNNGSFITSTSNDVEKLIENKESFILFTYNNYCTLPIPCEDIFKEFSKNYKIDVLSIPYGEFKDTSLYKEVKLSPSVIIIKEGKIISYLHADKDEDLEKYQDVNKYKNWLNNYIYFNK